MPLELNAKIEVENTPLMSGSPIRVRLVVTNQTESLVSVINPDVGRPPDELNWTFSNETFQIAVLLSFHLIGMSVTSASGGSVPQVGPHPWVTPFLMPRLELAPGDSFVLRINLSDHFELQQVGKYHLTIEYGDEHAFAHAETELLVEQPRTEKR